MVLDCSVRHLMCQQAELLASGLDLVVATPGRLVEHLEAGNLDLSACKAVILDEVDVLLGGKALSGGG